MTEDMTAFQTPEDVANRALQHCGAPLIDTLADDDKGARAVRNCYDKLRRAELRRNVWTFAVKRAVLYPISTPISSAAIGSTTAPTLLLVPAPWSATKQYDRGAIVSYLNNVWVSTASTNVGVTPGASATTNWDTYFGSMCVNQYDSTISYFAGDLVYIGNQVYVSLENSNSVSPEAISTYSSTAVYGIGQIIADAQGWYWQSNINNNVSYIPGVYGSWSSVPTYAVGAYVIGTDFVLYKALLSNTNTNPAGGAHPTQWQASGFPGSWPLWDSTRTYASGDVVQGSDGYLYQATQGSNTNHQPVGSTYNPNTPSSNWWVALGKKAPWVANFTSTTASSAWLGLDATMDNININYPIGAGPSQQSDTRNAFMLPHGYLREAPQKPKEGANSFLGAPSGLMYNDWEHDGNFILSSCPSPIIYRFVGDVVVVSKMDDMFCEGFAARVGLQICEALTQSNAKIATIEREYKKFIDDARTINGIEQGATEPPEDDYITCRI